MEVAESGRVPRCVWPVSVASYAPRSAWTASPKAAKNAACRIFLGTRFFPFFEGLGPSTAGASGRTSLSLLSHLWLRLALPQLFPSCWRLLPQVLTIVTIPGPARLLPPRSRSWPWAVLPCLVAGVPRRERVGKRRPAEPPAACPGQRSPGCAAKTARTASTSSLREAWMVLAGSWSTAHRPFLWPTASSGDCSVRQVPQKRRPNRHTRTSALPPAAKDPLGRPGPRSTRGPDVVASRSGFPFSRPPSPASPRKRTPVGAGFEARPPCRHVTAPGMSISSLVPLACAPACRMPARARLFFGRSSFTGRAPLFTASRQGRSRHRS